MTHRRGLQPMLCAKQEGLFRIIQSIPAKAEAFKRWLPGWATKRIQEN